MPTMTVKLSSHFSQGRGIVSGEGEFVSAGFPLPWQAFVCIRSYCD
jgi:hypothetical protein